MSDETLTFTVEDAARLLGISRGLAYEAARRGELPTIRLGRRLLVPRARLLELLGEREEVVDEMSERRATGGAFQPENAGDPVL